uniref:Calponin-homology (CH) domain-containing protein n=1 Tax=Coccidioides posadasii RMSCC 3488 TaxID=454284 RepID=A0A0J6FRP0_COCPO|nr:hypothetical protein CPAG_08020 [Coccidioides posadasii RMSCC 3488]
MASVTSLDKDLRSLRLSRYTPQAANEIRDWIEEVLQERLPPGDFLEALKDGVALCRLVNLAVGSPGVKYKVSTMPFVQMENISHFLHACQMVPLSLQPHDVFLTVDLYESKDPAQVLQCLIAFSRRAHTIQPARFPRAIGKIKSDLVSPQLSGSSQTGFKAPSASGRNRGTSNVSESGSKPFSPVSGRSSPEKRPPASPSSPGSAKVSAWSTKTEEATTLPAWNIHQYGYMGGASQGNLGISFGARRQITSQTPPVPSLAEKERRRKEAAEEEERRRRKAEEAERQRQLEREAEEQRAREEEERRWEEETRKLREKERLAVEEEKRQWEAEQRQWEEEDRRRQQEEREAEERLEKERQRKRGLADARLNGQFLSQYQAGQRSNRGTSPGEPAPTPERERIKALERELELAKERERQYERERQELARSRQVSSTSNASQDSARSRPPPKPAKPSYDLTSQEEERKLLRSEWQANQDAASTFEHAPPALPPRSLPEPPVFPRPLPDPANYPKTRTDRFLATNPAPQATQPASHRPPEFSTEAEVDEENRRRVASTQKTRAGGWASKSLLEREMERERERQREWEENQKHTREAAKSGVNTAGTGPGEGGWDVNQYGYIGGDNQNRGSTGIGFGARRQIIGPRPPR